MTGTVLVVEDTELLRRIYADALEHEGYRVLTAANGLEALALLQHERPDVILLDLVMPQMGGIEVLRDLRADPRFERIPVLILSNLGQEEDLQRALALGATDYMIKNEVRPADISLRIAAALREAESAPEVRSYRLYVRDHEGDADALIAHAGLIRRFWCPACEVELSLVLVPDRSRPGWFEARFECPSCAREF